MLEEAIVNLLLRHNCVVVPAFGGFVAQSSGAIIDMNTGVISPPRKSVLFNKQLINNDGLLISHLSKESDFDYATAESFLASKVEEWQVQLKEGQRVSIDKIGHLYLDAERNISFEQDRYFNLLLQSYGLNKVHFISEEDVKLTETAVVAAPKSAEAKIIPVVVPVETSEEDKEETKVAAIAAVGSQSKLWKYVAAAVLLPIAFFTYWIPVETSVLQSGMISFKDFNPTYKAGEGVYQQTSFTFPSEFNEKEKSVAEIEAGLPKGLKTYYIEFAGKKVPVKVTPETVEEIIEPIVAQEIERVVVEKIVEEPIVVEEPKPVVEVHTMHYITGCFSDRANAESMVQKMKERGLNAEIIGENKGTMRVSAGGASNQSDFDQIVKKAQQIGYKGWKLD